MELIELEDFENDLTVLDKLLDRAKSGAEGSQTNNIHSVAASDPFCPLEECVECL